MGKLKLALLLLCIFVASIAIGAAIQQYIISNTVTVTVEDYTLTLTVNATTCAVGDTLLFSGTLETASFLIEGANVTLYCNSLSTGFWNLTDVDGYYEILYQVTQAGTFDFYANATITT